MKNEFQVTKELYMSWGKENMCNGSRLKFRVFWCVMAVILICLIFLMCVTGGTKNLWLAYTIMMLLYCIYNVFFKNAVLTKTQYKKNAKLFGENWVRTIEFGEDEIINSDGSIKVKIPYSEIAGMRDEGNKIWLYTKKEMVIRLYKDKFVDGDFEKFKKLISVKIGK